MLVGWRKRLFCIGIVLLIAGIAFLILPEYSEYCQSTHANDKYCSTYQIASSFGAFLESHNGAITAIATIFIGWFTFTLKRSTDKLWSEAREQRQEAKVIADRQFENTEKSIRLARDEFISTHRPKIIVREAIIGSVMEGEPITVHYHLANIGETNGRIIRSMVRAEIVPQQGRLLLHGSVENQYDLGEITLGPGAAILLKLDRDTRSGTPII